MERGIRGDQRGLTGITTRLKANVRGSLEALNIFVQSAVVHPHVLHGPQPTDPALRVIFQVVVVLDDNLTPLKCVVESHPLASGVYGDDA